MLVSDMRKHNRKGNPRLRKGPQRLKISGSGVPDLVTGDSRTKNTQVFLKEKGIGTMLIGDQIHSAPRRNFKTPKLT